MNAPLLMNPASEAQQAGVARRLADKEAAAHRLRARGFSYRRIAETLRIRYDTVSRWLYGAHTAAPPPRHQAQTPAATPAAANAPGRPAALRAAPAAAASDGHGAGALSLRTAALEARIVGLEASLSRFQADAAAREERLLAELSGVRDALAAVSAQASTRGGPAGWLRGRERA